MKLNIVHVLIKAASMGLWFVLSFYAIVLAIGAILQTRLPETKGVEIPDTIEETEKLGSKKKNEAELQLS